MAVECPTEQLGRIGIAGIANPGIDIARVHSKIESVDSKGTDAFERLTAIHASVISERS